MAKNILVINVDIRETRVALIENGIIAELHIERETQKGTLGNIYLGKVSRVLPGMQAAFIDVGLERAAFLHVEDLIRPDDFEAYLAGHRRAHDEERSAKPSPQQALAEDVGAAGPPGEPLGDEVGDEALAIEAEAALDAAAAEAEASGEHEGHGHHEDAEDAGDDAGSSEHEAHEHEHEHEGHEAHEHEAHAAHQEHAAHVARDPNEAPSAPEAAIEPMTIVVDPVDVVITEARVEVGEAHEGAVEGAAVEVAGIEGVSADGAAPEASSDGSAFTRAKVARRTRSSKRQDDGPKARDRDAGRQAAPFRSLLQRSRSRNRGGVARASRGATDLLNNKRVATTATRAATTAAGAVAIAAEAAAAGDGRGGRDQGGPKRSNDPMRVSKQTPIREVVREGQEVVVQISKEPIGTKGARVTSHVSLPGRYVVYLPTVDHVGISKRIGSEKERARLRESIESMKPPTGGLIVRTVAEGLTKKQLKADIGYLVRLWGEVITTREVNPRPPVCLYTELDLVTKTARDLFTDDIEKIVIDSREEYVRLKKFIEMFMPERADAVELYDGEEPIFDAYGIEEEIQRAQSRKVPLGSGGHLIIDQAEALTAIDVNTGRFVGKGSKDLEDTILKTNLEAVEEIAYQLRFRNIGGLIILDLIDMERAGNREKVRKRLEELLANDKAKTTLESHLGPRPHRDDAQTHAREPRAHHPRAV